MSCWGCEEFKQNLIPSVFKQGTVSVDIGLGHICAVHNSNQISCWGHNEFGQCDIPIEFHEDILITTVGELFSCVIKLNYQFGCWGFKGQEDMASEIERGVQKYSDNIEV
mmetsp:Transcript_21096/g.17500  ORF Transcript_21096/g.17500 Transcript_21096/m.17500 type:complete len:110 (+) Transcript_21096:189-518(+)